jgi:tripartite-type tricarboxylate transporter receptor subunit TctC
MLIKCGRGVLSAIALLAASILAANSASAQDYPTKPIHIVIPFGAGGGNDLFARAIGPKFSELIGQPNVIENKPGAGGRIAAAYVMEQPADGYTLFIGPSGVMAVSPAAYPNLPYHPTRDFIPLTMIANFPLILVVPANHPAKTVKELAAWAKANPGKSNYGSTSPAFTVPSELLKLKTGMPGQMIPYKSSNEMVLSVIQEQSLFVLSDGPPAISQIKGGKVKALAVTGNKRIPDLPDVPSMAEAGYPEVNTYLWSGFFISAKTPPAIVAKVESALRKAITDPDVSAKLRALAVSPNGGSSAEFRKVIEADIESYRAVIKAANLKFDN